MDFLGDELRLNLELLFMYLDSSHRIHNTCAIRNRKNPVLSDSLGEIAKCRKRVKEIGLLIKASQSYKTKQFIPISNLYLLLIILYLHSPYLTKK